MMPIREERLKIEFMQAVKKFTFIFLIKKQMVIGNLQIYATVTSNGRSLQYNFTPIFFCFNILNYVTDINNKRKTGEYYEEWENRTLGKCQMELDKRLCPFMKGESCLVVTEEHSSSGEDCTELVR